MTPEVLPSSRKEAKVLKARHYFTGRPCKHGHISKRRVSGACLKCCIVSARAYEKRHHEKHLLNSTKRIERFHEAHPEWKRERAKQYRRLQPIARKKAVMKWKAKNPLYHKNASRAWNENNPELRRAKDHRRRAKVAKAEGRFTGEDIRNIFSSQNGRCYWCCAMMNRHTIDHLVPISKGGTNWPDNIRLACMPCNLAKNAIMPLDFACRLLS